MRRRERLLMGLLHTGPELDSSLECDTAYIKV